MIIQVQEHINENCTPKGGFYNVTVKVKFLRDDVKTMKRGGPTELSKKLLSGTSASKASLKENVDFSVEEVSRSGYDGEEAGGSRWKPDKSIKEDLPHDDRKVALPSEEKSNKRSSSNR